MSAAAGPFSAADVSWQSGAACAGSGFEFVPPVESALELEIVRTQWCNLCEVRPQCLLYALLYHQHGYWGGTDTAERRKLAKRRDRAKCPSCLSKAVISTDGHQICQRCAVSWAGTPGPHLAEETPA